MAVHDPIGPFPEPDDPEVRAFVLRVRAQSAGLPASLLVHLEDVSARRHWNFTSLDAAFAEIREVLKPSGGATPSPVPRH